MLAFLLESESIVMEVGCVWGGEGIQTTSVTVNSVCGLLIYVNIAINPDSL